jgi:predicted enzyme related to lactoylglutathione lyase
MPVTSTYPHGTFSCPGYCSGDAAAAKTFYSSLFRWQPHDMQMPEGDYVMFKLGGNNVAGMYQMADARKKAGVQPHWNSYLAVSNIADTVKKAETLGGKVLMQPSDAGGDLMANLQDPLGAKFSVWQFGKVSEPTLLNDIGALCWTELYTTDMAAASNFYTQLVGWKAGAFEASPMPYTMFTPANANMPIGGMLKITEEMEGMQPQWLPYFRVEDADKSAELARKLGAKIHGPWDIPTVGRMAMAQDTEGACFAFIKLG